MPAQLPEKREYYTHFCDAIEMRDNDKGGKTIYGYAAVYYRADDPGTEFVIYPGLVERIKPGAFASALSRPDDVRGLFNHDGNSVLGRMSAGTLRLSTNKRGLQYEIDLPDTQMGRDLSISIGRGDITGSSFAFTVDRDGQEWEEAENGKVEVRWLTDVKLYDVSPVTWPAYEATSVAARSVEAALRDLENERSREREENLKRWRLRKARTRLAGLKK